MLKAWGIPEQPLVFMSHWKLGSMSVKVFGGGSSNWMNVFTSREQRQGGKTDFLSPGFLTEGAAPQPQTPLTFPGDIPTYPPTGLSLS